MQNNKYKLDAALDIVLRSQAILEELKTLPELLEGVFDDISPEDSKRFFTEFDKLEKLIKEFD